jgi:hypothetical protein
MVDAERARQVLWLLSFSIFILAVPFIARGEEKNGNLHPDGMTTLL